MAHGQYLKHFVLERINVMNTKELEIKMVSNDQQLKDAYKVRKEVFVLKESRVSGAGKSLMESIELFAKKQGIQQLKLNAQTHAIPFYSKLGYEIVSDEFYEAGIPHQSMLKTI